MTRIAVVVDGEVTTRAAHSMATHPGIDEVVLVHPATSNAFRTVTDTSECDLVVGTNRSADKSAPADIPVVVAGPDLEVPGFHTASLEGLALALAVGVGDVAQVAVAGPGREPGSEMVVFPSPIDSVAAVATRIDGHSILSAESPDLAAALVTGSRLHRVVMDDSKFLAAIALAAAAAAALDEPPDAPAPVWTRAPVYLRAATAMGLVIGERPALS